MPKTINYSDNVTLIPSGYSSANSRYSSVSSSYPISNGYANTSSSTYAYITCRTGSRASTYISYTFDVSDIPSTATIDSISCKARVRVSSTSYISTATCQLYNNTTAKGSTTSTRSTTATTYTLSNLGTWTRNELNNIQLRFTGTRGTRNTSSAAYLYFYGAELTINYTVSGTAYTIDVTNNVSGITVDPMTQDIIAGESGEVFIYTSSLTGINVTDNGNNINTSLTHISGTSGTYEIEQRGTYGFALNNNDYYESQNKGINQSAAVCRVNFSLPVSATVTINYINYAEAAYDFGVFGNIDVELNTNHYPAGSNGATISDSNYKRACNTSSYNSSSVQTLTYSNVSAGDHFIDIKFSKDDASAEHNDTLQFRVTITYNQAVSYYSYTINNISADHVIVINSSSTQQDAAYFKVNGTWRQVSQIYKKINGTWVLQTDYSAVFGSSTNYKT